MEEGIKESLDIEMSMVYTGHKAQGKDPQMDGIFINLKDGVERRPKSKKEVRELAAISPEAIWIEGTSFFDPWSGKATEIPEGTTITFVGPDPYTKRNFYGNITRKGDKVTVK